MTQTNNDDQIREDCKILADMVYMAETLITGGGGSSPEVFDMAVDSWLSLYRRHIPIISKYLRGDNGEQTV